jgi:hypothetical protein
MFVLGHVADTAEVALVLEESILAGGHPVLAWAWPSDMAVEAGPLALARVELV